MVRSVPSPLAFAVHSPELRRHRTSLRAFAYIGLSWLYLTILVAGCLGPLQLFAYLPGYVSDFSPDNFSLASFLVVIAAALLPKREDGATLFAWLILFLFLVPMAAVFACSDRDALLPLGSFAAFLAAVGLVSGVPLRARRSHPRDIDRFLRSDTINLVLVLMIGFSVVMLALAVITQGAPTLEALDLDKVYDIRGQSTMGSGMSALMQLASLMFVPLVITIFLCRGQRLAALGMSGLQLLFYLSTANKAWFLVVVLIWGLYLVTRFSIKPLPLLALLTGGVAAATMLTWLFPERCLAAYSLLVRRLLILPAILRFDYFAFFQDHPTVGLQGTLPGMLLPDESAYGDVDYQVQISQMTWGSFHSTHANTGLFGGEFANFGLGAFVAIVVNLMLLLAFFRVSPRNEKSREFQSMLAVLSAFILLNISSVRLLYSSIGLAFVAASVVLFLCLDQSWGASKNVSRASHGDRESSVCPQPERSGLL